MRSQIAYAAKGAMRLTANGRSWAISQFGAIWVPGGTEHNLVMIGNVEMVSLYLHASAAAKMPGEITELSVSPLVRELFNWTRTQKPFSCEHTDNYQLLQVLMDQLVAIYCEWPKLPLPTDSRAARVAEALVDNPADQTDLKTWGLLVGATSRTLTRRFLLECGMTFRQWRRQLRMRIALQRLRSGHSVTETSLDVGYDSLSAFIGAFKRQFGHNPSHYSDR